LVKLSKSYVVQTGNFVTEVPTVENTNDCPYRQQILRP